MKLFIIVASGIIAVGCAGAAYIFAKYGDQGGLWLYGSLSLLFVLFPVMELIKIIFPKLQARLPGQKTSFESVPNRKTILLLILAFIMAILAILIPILLR